MYRDLHRGLIIGVTAMIVSASFAGVAIAQPGSTSICRVQGSGPSSPLEGEQVITTGIVTTVDGNGIWIQAPGCDDDPATSNGVFVFRGVGGVGQRVRVSGQVTEYFGLTELEAENTTVLGSAEVPAPTVIEESAASASGYYETLEGMLVRLPRGQTYVGTNKFAETFLTPGDTPTRVRRTEQVPQMLALDDGLPDVGPLNAFAFDMVAGAFGPLSFTFSNYKLLVSNPGEVEVRETDRSRNLRAAVARGPEGALSVATWNLLNVFDEIEDGGPATPEPSPGQQAVKRAKIARGVVDQLAAPAVLAVQEVEKKGLLVAIAAEVDQYAASQGLSTDYVALSRPSSDGRGIQVGFLLDTTRVRYSDVRRLGVDAVSDGRCEGEATGDESVFERFPLAVDVRPAGASEAATVTVVSSHFKSKFAGTPENEFFEPCRVEQAEVLRAAVREQERVILLGDFNAFRDSPTLRELTRGGYVNTVDQIPKPRRYSFVYQGRVQFLDHIVVSASLREAVATVDSAKLDTGTPFPRFENDPGTGFATSDHDPLIAYLDLSGGASGQNFPFGPEFPFGEDNPFDGDFPFGSDATFGPRFPYAATTGATF